MLSRLFYLSIPFYSFYSAAVEHAVISRVGSTSFYDCVTVLIALFICPADDMYPGRGRGGEGVLAMGMGRRDDRKQ